MEALKLLKINAANAISLSSVPFGLAAFYYASRHEAFLSLVLITACFFIDTMDGYVARKTKIESEYGRTIDSFCDLIIYILFPCFFIYEFLNFNLYATLFSCAMLIIFGILRLSRFNAEGITEIGGKKYYKGLITPFALATTAVFYVISKRYYEAFLCLLPFAIVALSFLMVSNIKFRKINNWPWYLLAAFLLWMAY